MTQVNSIQIDFTSLMEIARQEIITEIRYWHPHGGVKISGVLCCEDESSVFGPKSPVTLRFNQGLSAKEQQDFELCVKKQPKVRQVHFMMRWLMTGQLLDQS